MAFCLSLHAAVPFCSAGQTFDLVVAKPFGPTIKNPDPAKGSNGWYTSEAGVTETLFALDFSMEPIPLLAQSCENTDPTHWTVTLKPVISFHDGTPVTAQAVKWNFDRITNRQSPVYNVLIASLLDLKSIRITNERTLVFETNKANAAFLYDLTSPEASIISPSSGADAFYATGPFRLESMEPGVRMVVNRFDGYWKEKARLGRVCLNIIQNPASRMLAFEAGQIDLAVNFPEIDGARLATNPKVNLYHQPTNRLCFFFVRVKDGPLAEPRIRRALNLAIDRKQLIDHVLYGFGGKAAASIFPEHLPWYNDRLSVHPYDPVKAKTLLDEAGAVDTDKDGIREYNGKPLVLNAWTYEGRASLKPTLELIQVQLQNVGIMTRLRVTKKGSPINSAMERGQVQLNLQMWNVAPQGDPDFFIANVFTSKGVSNFSGYANPEMDRLVRQGKTTFDPQERRKIYNAVQDIIYRDSPVIVLFHKSLVTAANNHVGGYRIHPAEKYLLTPGLYKK